MLFSACLAKKRRLIYGVSIREPKVRQFVALQALQALLVVREAQQCAVAVGLPFPINTAHCPAQMLISQAQLAEVADLDVNPGQNISDAGCSRGIRDVGGYGALEG